MLIYNGRTIPLNKPKIIIPDENSGFNLFSKDLTPEKSSIFHKKFYTYPSVYCERYKDAKFLGPNVGFFNEKDNEIQRTFNDTYAAKKKIKMENFNKAKEIFINKITLNLSTIYSNNYYHWMFEVLPKIKIAKIYNVESNHILLGFSREKFHKEYFRILKLDHSKMLPFFEKEFIYKFEDLILPQIPPRPSIESIEFLKSLIKPEKKAYAKEKIFLTRNNKYRNFVNEKEIQNFLISKGFEIIDCEKYSLQQQADLFYNAKIILGAHGSHFANIIYCQSKTHIVEFFNQEYIYGVYFRISSMLDFNYYTAISIPKESNLEIIHRQIDIDLNVVKSIVNKI